MYGDQDGALEAHEAGISDSDVVEVSYSVGANADTPVRGAVLTHKVGGGCAVVRSWSWR